MRSLTRIQLGDAGAVTAAGLPLAADIVQQGTTNVLRELKGSNLGTGMNHMDAMTLDIMAMLFDQLFDDPKIPMGVKGLIGRLQIPMLKVAIADKAFFSKKTHPARQMLDTLGEISARLPADFDASNALYGRLESILHELIDGFEDDLEIFNGVRERLQTLVAEEDHRIEQETKSSAKQVEQKENLAVAKTVAQAEIKVRIRGARVPVPVLKFLVQEWIKYLIVVQVKSGENSDDWKIALKTIEQLIWSVEPKETAEERRKLVTMLPELLKRLAAGAQLAGVEDAVRSSFFADLRKLHTEIIGKATAANGAPAADSLAHLESAPAAIPAPPSPIEAVQPVSALPETTPAPTEASPLIAELPDLTPAPAEATPLVPELPDLTPAAAEAAPPVPELPDLPFSLTEATPPAPVSPAKAPEPREAPRPASAPPPRAPEPREASRPTPAPPPRAPAPQQTPTPPRPPAPRAAQP
ncbi:MAG: DUF1631 family protein, partial [Burkholderiales bacterium]